MEFVFSLNILKMKHIIYHPEWIIPEPTKTMHSIRVVENFFKGKRFVGKRIFELYQCKHHGEMNGVYVDFEYQE